MVAALPADHPPGAAQAPEPGRSWRREPLLLYPAKPRPSYADQVLEMFRSRGLRPTVALETNEVQTAIGLVVAGIGYALVPQSVRLCTARASSTCRSPMPASSSPVIMNCRSATRRSHSLGSRNS